MYKSIDRSTEVYKTVFVIHLCVIIFTIYDRKIIPINLDYHNMPIILKSLI